MTTDLPLVTVVVPVVDEGDRIEGCLAALAAQDWPTDRVEVLVVDGGSRDGTVAAAEAALARGGLGGRVVTHAGAGGRSANLNRGLAEAQGELLCRVDARSRLPPTYIRRCVARLADPAVAVVGGTQRAVAPEGAGARSRGIARALNNRLAMGAARYRRRDRSGPADTVYLGAFRTADLRAVGGWDEGLDVNEDFDLNTRLGARGSVWFDVELAVAYRPRDDVRAIARQYWGFGRGKVRYLRQRGARPRLRQVLGLAVAPALVATGVGVLLLPRRARAVAVLGAAATAVALEHAGAEAGTAAPARERAWSLLTCVTVVACWSAGGCAEVISGRRRG